MTKIEKTEKLLHRFNCIKAIKSPEQSLWDIMMYLVRNNIVSKRPTNDEFIELVRKTEQDAITFVQRLNREPDNGLYFEVPDAAFRIFMTQLDEKIADKIWPND